MKALWIACALLLISVSGCGNGDQAQTSADSSATSIPSGTYAVDRSHTYVTFSYFHQGLSYPLLRATDIDGELELNIEQMEMSKVGIAVGVDSIRTNLDYFDDELASRKFFHSDKYPYITFATHQYEQESESLGKLTGLVTIRGITRPVVLDVLINGAMEHPFSKTPVIGFSASGNLKRSDFGLDRGIPIVADMVTINVEAEFLLGSNEGSAAAAKLAVESVADGFDMASATGAKQ